MLARRASSLLVLGALLCAAGPARAQPGPLADQASGIAVDEPTPVAEKLYWIPRIVLFVPRWTFWLVMAPVRLGGWAYERYRVRNRIAGVLFSVDETYGIHPVASYSTDFGVTFGLRAVHHNLFGKGEELKLRGEFGGEFKQSFGLHLSTGRRLAERFSASIDLRYERRPADRFFGIGNSGELEMPPPTLIDPATSDDAFSTRFREKVMRAKSTLDARLAGPFSARATGALTSREFGSDASSDENIAAYYDTSRLIGFSTGLDHVYLEGELVYDSRRPTSTFQSQAIDAAGWYVAAHVGRAKGISGDPTAFTHYGGEVQGYFDIYRGSRVLALRVAVDGIAGSDGRTDGKISFVDLPRLGGPDYLRGYPIDRFRDRTTALATAEYSWDAGNYLAGYLFVDVGRAAKKVTDLDYGSFHVGYGGGVQVHTYRSFLMRGQLALSGSGDVFVQLAVSPAFGRRERQGRH